MMPFFDERREQALGGHAFGHVIYLVDDLVDGFRVTEQAFGGDVSDDVVDRVLVDGQAGELRADKLLRGLFDRAVPFHAFDVDAGHHAVPYRRLRKVEGVLEQPDVLVGLVRFVVLGRLVEQVREVFAVERGDALVALERQASQLENADGDERGQLGQREEKQVEKVDRNGERLVVGRRVEAHDGFGDEFGHEDDDDRRDDRFDGECSSASGGDARQREQVPDQGAHLERIDDQRDVVAHENGRDVLARIFGEQIGDEAEYAAFFLLDFQLQFVRREEGDFHTRKKGGYEKRYEDDETDRKHGKDGVLNRFAGRPAGTKV